MEMLWLQKMKNVTIHVDTRSTLSKASLEHHKAMILYIQCSRPTADIQTQADGTSADTIPSLFS